MAGAAGFADFDSASGLLRALAAALRGEPFRHLGQGPVMAAAARAADGLSPRRMATAMAMAGVREAVRPSALGRVSAEDLARKAVGRYQHRPSAAVFVGSSNGALVHLAAALRAPWLPQTFLVPVRRRADPDDPQPDLQLARRESRQLLTREPTLQLHQMHDPNQDRVMLSRLGYFRFKLRALPPAYRRFIRAVLPPGGTLVVADTRLRWPVIELGERHVFQPGAVGGLRPADYLERWPYPAPNSEAAEAEWGFESALLDDVMRLAWQDGYRVLRLGIPDPDQLGGYVADLFRRWYAEHGHRTDRLLVETFICVEPFWALATATVPLWTTFPVRSCLQSAAEYVDRERGWSEIAATLFPHGTHSEGIAEPAEWQRLTDRATVRGWLPGVDAARWPLNVGALDRYAAALHADRPAPLVTLPPMPSSVLTEDRHIGPDVAVERLA